MRCLISVLQSTRRVTKSRARGMVWVSFCHHIRRMGRIDQLAVAGKLTAGSSPRERSLPMSCSGGDRNSPHPHNATGHDPPQAIESTTAAGNRPLVIAVMLGELDIARCPCAPTGTVRDRPGLQHLYQPWRELATDAIATLKHSIQRILGSAAPLAN